MSGGEPRDLTPDVLYTLETVRFAIITDGIATPAHLVSLLGDVLPDPL